MSQFVITAFLFCLTGIISQKHKAATGFTDYEIHDSSLTFHEAKSMCEHLGATLAPFKENHNFSFLITNVKLPAFGHFWIQGMTFVCFDLSKVISLILFLFIY